MNVPWKELKKEHLQETFERFKKDKLMQCFAMAGEVVLTTMGLKWWERHLVESSEGDYFNAKAENKNAATYQYRVILFGDRLWALKNIAGYSYFIQSLRSQDIASTLFELEAAHMLHASGYQLIFVERTMKKGADYDLRATIFNESVNIEAKSKKITTALGDGNTLTNTLNNARKQLPKNQIGMVFLEIPEEWTKQAHAKTIITDCVSKFFMNTTRVKKIVFMWREQHFKANGETIVFTKIKEFGHPNFSGSLVKNQLFRRLDSSDDSIILEDKLFKPSFCLGLL